MNLIKESTTVGFIGLGIMGKSMAANILKAGFNLVIYSRTKSKASELLELGASWKDSPEDVAKESSIIITMVGYPKDVEEIYFGENGLLQHSQPGTVLIDMTTTKPRLAQKIYEKALKNGHFSLDAPVSGGDIGAKQATLSIMVGGDLKTFDAVRPLFEVIGKNIVYQGPAGAGQHTKMCNQIAIATNMIGICEAMAYAENAGLNPESVLQSIESGAAGSWSLSNLVPRILKEDYSPGFFIEHFVKDMGIAIEAAEEMGIELPGLELSKRLYDRLLENGEGKSGTQALYKLYK